MKNIDLQELYRAARPSVDKDPLAALPKSLYRFVWKVSGAQQVRVCLLTMLPLELQRRIINSALQQVDIAVLTDLGAVYRAVLVLSGTLKYVRNLDLGRVSEGVIRRLRTWESQNTMPRQTKDVQYLAIVAIDDAIDDASVDVKDVHFNARPDRMHAVTRALRDTGQRLSRGSIGHPRQTALAA